MRLLGRAGRGCTGAHLPAARGCLPAVQLPRASSCHSRSPNPLLTLPPTTPANRMWAKRRKEIAKIEAAWKAGKDVVSLKADAEEEEEAEDEEEAEEGGNAGAKEQEQEARQQRQRQRDAEGEDGEAKKRRSLREGAAAAAAGKGSSSGARGSGGGSGARGEGGRRRGHRSGGRSLLEQLGVRQAGAAAAEDGAQEELGEEVVAAQEEAERDSQLSSMSSIVPHVSVLCGGTLEGWRAKVGREGLLVWIEAASFASKAAGSSPPTHPAYPCSLHPPALRNNHATKPAGPKQGDAYVLESPRPVVTYMSRNFFSRGVLNEPDLLRYVLANYNVTLRVTTFEVCLGWVAGWIGLVGPWIGWTSC